MNILIYTTAFHPSIGGLENQTLSLIDEFLKKGHNVKVITVNFQPVTVFNGIGKLLEVDIHDRPSFFKTIQLFLWCNTLYMPNISLKGIWVLLINPFKKWIVSHNDFYLSNRKSLKIKFKLFLIKFASQNIAVSKSVADYIDTKCTVIYNCYNNEIFKIYNEERIYDFVFLGRLVSQKGCDLLIKACKNLREPFTLSIIGDGPERLNLEKLVRELGLEKNIKFMGILEGEYLARMLNRHKTMVIPSIGEEGFGTVVLEGMACGCRIIAADAGGLPEAVNVFGKIFKMKDQKQLESLLAKELTELRKQFNTSITTDLNNYLTAHKKETIAHKYLSLFQ